MGKFVMGLVIGLVAGLIFANTIFPDGFFQWVQQFSSQVQHQIPGR